MSKLYRARSLLYRRQILQENIRWKALDEIYKSYMLLHRSDLNISANCVKLLRIFRQNEVWDEDPDGELDRGGRPRLISELPSDSSNFIFALRFRLSHFHARFLITFPI